MKKGEIQSLEVSCLIHATEDEVRVTEALLGHLGGAGEVSREVLEGHFGNGIVRLRVRVTGAAAAPALARMLSTLGHEGLRRLRDEMAGMIDEHSALYVRLGKQELVQGRAVISAEDPVRVRVKPRPFVARDDPVGFYARLLGTAES